METRTTETVGFETDTPPLYSIRWAAVIAGLAVGLGVHLLLMLLGAAAGFAVYGAGERPDGTTVSMAAAIWNGLSMLISALVGGYVAARSSGLRRTSDGVLHAVASWGASMLVYALLATSVAGSALTGAFGMAATAATGISSSASNGSGTAITDLLAGMERGDRSATISMLRDRFGLSNDQASRLADRAMAMRGDASSAGNTAGSGSAGTATPDNTGTGAPVTDVARTASAASAWLSLVILLSLLAGAGGGVVGARGSLKRSLPGRYAERRVVRNHSGGHGLSAS